MKYIVTRAFNDAKDEKTHYDLNSEFPNREMPILEERIAFLIENGNIREKEQDELNVSELIEKAVKEGLTVELNQDTYNREYLISILENKQNDSIEALNLNEKDFTEEEIKEKKKLMKKLSALMIDYSEDMSIEELRKLLENE